MKVLDLKAIDNIRALQRPGATDLLERIIGIFESETPSGIEKIRAGIASGDFPAIQMAAHSMKSSAAYVGATDFSNNMAELEKAARDEQMPSCETLSENLDNDYAIVMGELSLVRDSVA